MAGVIGRPPNWGKPEDLQKDAVEIAVGSQDDFANEKEFCDFIARNAENIANDVFGKEIKYVNREDNFLGRGKFMGRLPRVDFRLDFKDGSSAIVECKHPKKNRFHELSRALGQILSYSVLAERSDRKVQVIALFVTRYEEILGDVIKKFKLPVEVYVIGRKGVAKLYGY